MKNTHTYLTKDKSKNTIWKLENEDEIDEPHKSQLKFEYNVYLLNYTIRNKNLKPKLGFEVLRF